MHLPFNSVNYYGWFESRAKIFGIKHTSRHSDSRHNMIIISLQKGTYKVSSEQHDTILHYTSYLSDL